MAGVPMTAAELIVFPAVNVLLIIAMPVILKRIHEPEKGK
jgi:hypothetical protein